MVLVDSYHDALTNESYAEFLVLDEGDTYIQVRQEKKRRRRELKERRRQTRARDFYRSR